MELISHIKESVALAQEKRRFLTTLRENGILVGHYQGVIKIGKERWTVLVAHVHEEEFLQTVAAKTPEEIIYEMVNMRDEFIAADFYAKLSGRTFIQATGLLEADSGAETLFTRLYDLSYRMDQHHTYKQRWGKLALHKAESK